MKKISCLIFLIMTVNSFGQEKEVLIMGTMHTVPKIVKNSYKPLLKYAIKYNPDAIYVERVRPIDTMSLNYYSKNFVRKSDSLKKVFNSDDNRFDSLKYKSLKFLTKEDFEFIAKTYYVKKDYANYYYYNYLKKFGISGSKKPLRNKNADLTSKLAIEFNIKHIFSMDDQKTNKEYHKFWRKCAKIGEENGDNDVNKKLNKKDYNSSIIPAIFGRLGKHTNKQKSLNRKHLLNSFRYVQFANSDCKDATKYWDERNYNMAKNIAEQIKVKENRKNIVIVGAGHVIGIKEALKQYYPELRVRLMYE